MQDSTPAHQPADPPHASSPWLRVSALAALLFAGLLLYSQTLAFAWDEGFHLLAAQLIKAGKRPYLDFCFPQTPLNAYLNAGWMKLFGESWRPVHALAAFWVVAGAMLAAGFVLKRFPVSRWRLAGACAVLVAVAMNSQVVLFGPIGQAYGLCLFLSVAAFRLTVCSVERRGPQWAAAAGLLAGAAAASSLLTAAVARHPQPRRRALAQDCAVPDWRRHPVSAGAAAVPRISQAGALQHHSVPDDVPPHQVGRRYRAGPFGADLLDRFRAGAHFGAALGARCLVYRPQERLGSRTAFRVLSGRLVGFGLRRRAGHRASHLRALLSAGHPVRRHSGDGRIIRRCNQARPRRAALRSIHVSDRVGGAGPGKSHLGGFRFLFLERLREDRATSAKKHAAGRRRVGRRAFLFPDAPTAPRRHGVFLCARPGSAARTVGRVPHSAGQENPRPGPRRPLPHRSRLLRKRRDRQDKPPRILPPQDRSPRLQYLLGLLRQTVVLSGRDIASVFLRVSAPPR